MAISSLWWMRKGPPSPAVIPPTTCHAMYAVCPQTIWAQLAEPRPLPSSVSSICLHLYLLSPNDVGQLHFGVSFLAQAVSLQGVVLWNSRSLWNLWLRHWKTKQREKKTWETLSEFSTKTVICALNSCEPTSSQLFSRFRSDRNSLQKLSFLAGDNFIDARELRFILTSLGEKLSEPQVEKKLVSLVNPKVHCTLHMHARKQPVKRAEPDHKSYWLIMQTCHLSQRSCLRKEVYHLASESWERLPRGQVSFQADEMIRAGDKNGDGKIQYEGTLFWPFPS